MPCAGVVLVVLVAFLRVGVVPPTSLRSLEAEYSPGIEIEEGIPSLLTSGEDENEGTFRRIGVLDVEACVG